MSFLTGFDVHLYLDAAGMLVVTDKERNDLTPLGATRDVTLNIPLEGVVSANVEIIVSKLDLTIPLAEHSKFIVVDQEATPELIEALQKQIHKQRELIGKTAQQADEQEHQ